MVNPRFHFPFRLFDVVEVHPEVGYHGTVYEVDRLGSETRSLVTGLLDVRARLRKGVNLPGGGRGVHVLEPRLVYTGILNVDQADHPLLVPRPRVLQERIRQLEPTAVVRDPADRIGSVNAVTLALGQRVYVARGPGEDGAERAPRLWADVTLSAHWDFSDDTIRNVFVDGSLYPGTHWRTRFNVGWDLDESEIGEALLELGYHDGEGNDLRLGYRLVKQVPQFFEAFRYDDERFDEFDGTFGEIQQVDLLARWAFAPRWALTYRIAYSLERSLELQHQLGLEYVSACRCWAIRAEAEDDRSRGLEFTLRYRLLGLGDDSVRPFQRGRRSNRDPLIEDS